MPRALVTGVTGQDGIFLSRLLDEHGYQVFGLIRDRKSSNLSVVRESLPSIELIEGDLRDLPSLVAALEISQPDEVYNLAAESFVGLSWKQVELTGEVTGMGAVRLFEALRIHTENDMDTVRCYQASSSEMFGRAPKAPQNEATALEPRTPYGASKTFAHMMAGNYRDHYGAFIACGILYNHESEYRSPEFVPRKISRGVARIALGLQQTLALGDLDARRDWGFAGDYVRAMWMMLQQPAADDFVIATGTTHTIRDLLDAAFHRVGIDDWQPYVVQDPRFMRAAEPNVLVGDSSKAATALGWKPTVCFEELIHRMVDRDLDRERPRAAR